MVGFGLGEHVSHAFRIGKGVYVMQSFVYLGEGIPAGV